MRKIIGIVLLILGISGLMAVGMPSGSWYIRGQIAVELMFIAAGIYFLVKRKK